MTARDKARRIAGPNPTRSKGLGFDPIEEARRQWRAKGWQDSADGMAMITSIVRVDQIFANRIDDILRPLDLTFARYEVLMLLSFTRAGALPQGRIGARLQVHPASVTNAVTRLEEAGLVIRRRHETDGRTRMATITSAGRELAARATDLLNTQVFSDVGLTPRELQDLFTLLRKVRRNAGDFDETRPAPTRP